MIEPAPAYPIYYAEPLLELDPAEEAWLDEEEEAKDVLGAEDRYAAETQLDPATAALVGYFAKRAALYGADLSDEEAYGKGFFQAVGDWFKNLWGKGKTAVKRQQSAAQAARAARKPLTPAVQQSRKELRAAQRARRQAARAARRTALAKPVAAKPAGIRQVRGAGGYVYQQNPDGSVLVVEGPSRKGQTLRSGPAWEAITAEITAKAGPQAVVGWDLLGFYGAQAATKGPLETLLSTPRKDLPAAAARQADLMLKQQGFWPGGEDADDDDLDEEDAEYGRRGRGRLRRRRRRLRRLLRTGRRRGLFKRRLSPGARRRIQRRLERVDEKLEGEDDELGLIWFAPLALAPLALAVGGPRRRIKRAQRQLRKKGRVSPRLLRRLRKDRKRMVAKLPRIRRARKRARFQRMIQQINTILSGVAAFGGRRGRMRRRMTRRDLAPSRKRMQRRGRMIARMERRQSRGKLGPRAQRRLAEMQRVQSMAERHWARQDAQYGYRVPTVLDVMGAQLGQSPAEKAKALEKKMRQILGGYKWKLMSSVGRLTALAKQHDALVKAGKDSGAVDAEVREILADAGVSVADQDKLDALSTERDQYLRSGVAGTFGGAYTLIAAEEGLAYAA